MCLRRALRCAAYKRNLPLPRVEIKEATPVHIRKPASEFLYPSQKVDNENLSNSQEASFLQE